MSVLCFLPPRQMVDAIAHTSSHPCLSPILILLGIFGQVLRHWRHLAAHLRCLLLLCSLLTALSLNVNLGLGGRLWWFSVHHGWLLMPFRCQWSLLPRRLWIRTSSSSSLFSPKVHYGFMATARCWTITIFVLIKGGNGTWNPPKMGGIKPHSNGGGGLEPVGFQVSYPWKTQPNNKYENLISKGINLHFFYSNQTSPKCVDLNFLTARLI